MTETNGAKPKRALSYRQAKTCEEAVHPSCACRCHGAAHGAKRGTAPGPDAEPISRDWFEQLDDDDPHRVLSADEIAERRRKQRKESRERAHEALHQAELKRLDEWNRSALSLLAVAGGTRGA